MEDNLADAVEVLPRLGQAGIKRVINGPMIFSPDLGAAARPISRASRLFLRGRRDVRLQPGRRHRQGACRVDRRGRALDRCQPWDVARFGGWAGKGFTARPHRVFLRAPHPPHLPRPGIRGGRPMRTFPAHDREAAAARCSACSFGNEYRSGTQGSRRGAADRYRLRPQNWFDAVGRECRATREGVGPVRGVDLRQIRGDRSRRGQLARRAPGRPQSRRSDAPCSAPCSRPRAGSSPTSP